MARNFNGTSDRIDIAVTLAEPFTMVSWALLDTLLTHRTLMSLGDISSPNNYHGLRVFTDGTVHMYTWNGVDYGQSKHSDTPVFGSWHHYGGVWTSPSERLIYYDGSAGTVNNVNVVVNNENRIVSGTRADNSAAQYWHGGIAESAAWDVALTPSEMARLAAGYSPLSIRRQNLVYYTPLIRNAVNRMGAAPSVTGTTVVNHPRIIRPRSSVIFTLKTAGIIPVSTNMISAYESKIGARRAPVNPIESLMPALAAKTGATEVNQTAAGGYSSNVESQKYITKPNVLFWEGKEQVSSDRRSLYEITQTIARENTSFAEAQQTAAVINTVLFEVLRSTNGALATWWESNGSALTSIFSSRAGLIESLQRSQQAVTSRVDALIKLQKTGLSLWESLRTIESTRTSPHESNSQAAATSSAMIEALQQVLRAEVSTVEALQWLKQMVQTEIEVRGTTSVPTYHDVELLLSAIKDLEAKLYSDINIH